MAARRADGLDDDDFLTVEQLAELRRLMPAAVRAQLRAGNLAGQQVLQGQRTGWRIRVSAARRYLEKSGRSQGQAPSPPAEVRPAEPVTATSRAHLRLKALQADLCRLRLQLSALAGAHRRLLVALTADIAADRPGSPIRRWRPAAGRR